MQRLERHPSQAHAAVGGVEQNGRPTEILNIDHAESETLAHLRRAILMLDTTRADQHDAKGVQSCADWRALVRGKWLLLDQMDHDGHRYIVARRKSRPIRDPAALTARERQIVERVRLGHRNKVIAYELGIAAATVRVLLARAAAKIGARNREELLSALTLRRSFQSEFTIRD